MLVLVLLCVCMDSSAQLLLVFLCVGKDVCACIYAQQRLGKPGLTQCFKKTFHSYSHLTHAPTV